MSAKTTPDAPSGYPSAGPSALCAAAELNVTQSMILNTLMVPNSLSEADPMRRKSNPKRCPFHYFSFLGFESAPSSGPIVVAPVLYS